ncbi:hypothetical protein O6H91_23G045200 [Diphasiastrum complanatum]|nr:hypothetical protein O6H91_23G045200 [Diphasiastrum complanatum]
MSATSSEDVEKLKKLVLHNPVTLKLTEVDGQLDDSILPNSVQQYKISCKLHDKLLYMLVLLKFGLIQKKALIFVNSIDTSFRLKLFLEQFGIKSAVLNAELPQNSRLHILKAFNVGLFDYLLATDDCRTTGHHAGHNDEMAGLKEVDKSRSSSDNKGRRAQKDTEFGVVRGIDFKNVRTVVNYDMPPTISGYIHRVGRTGRAGNAGAAISLVSLEEEELLRSLEEFLSENVSTKNSTQLGPFPLLSGKAIESLRYRAEDVARGVTKIAVREARAKELRLEILNSDLLKTHFEDNPADLELLKHDKVLSKQQPASHLRTVPEYLRDPTTEAASMAVKAARAAMGQSTSRFYSNRKRRKPQSDDPLKAFSAGSKRLKGGKNDARGLPGTLWARKKGEKRGSSGESRGNSKSSNSSRKKLHRRRKR